VVDLAIRAARDFAVVAVSPSRRAPSSAESHRLAAVAEKGAYRIENLESGARTHASSLLRRV